MASRQHRSWARLFLRSRDLMLRSIADCFRGALPCWRANVSSVCLWSSTGLPFRELSDVEIRGTQTLAGRHAQQQRQHLRYIGTALVEVRIFLGLDRPKEHPDFHQGCTNVPQRLVLFVRACVTLGGPPAASAFGRIGRLESKGAWAAIKCCSRGGLEWRGAGRGAKPRRRVPNPAARCAAPT